MSNKKIVIFNAPGGAGKDSICKYMNKNLTYFTHLEIKAKLFELVKCISGISDQKWESIYTEELKEIPTPLLGGLSPRQFMIKVSEEVIKPNFGSDYFAQTAIKALKGGLNGFSDGGFYCELDEMIKVVGIENLLVVRIHRPGCNFDNDSRIHFDEKHPVCTGIQFIDYHNTRSEKYFHYDLSEIVKLWHSS